MSEDLFDSRTAPRGSLPSLLTPREIIYFGTVKRRAWIPSGALFASLLYFARREQCIIKIPPHLATRTRSEASRLGRDGPCIEDIEHFSKNCRTHLANFPAIDVGTLSSNPSEGSILGQTSYKLGTLDGPWQGSYIRTSLEEYAKWRSDCRPTGTGYVQPRTPLYFIFEEHYCYDRESVVPQDDAANGMKIAWLPEDLQITETQGGIEFSDSNGTFRAYYETYHHGQHLIQDERQVADVIITGKTDDQYFAVWGASSKILGRIRLDDGLIVLGKTPHWGLESETDQQMFKGYVTSSQNFVGRMKGPIPGSEMSYRELEGVFSLSKRIVEAV